MAKYQVEYDNGAVYEIEYEDTPVSNTNKFSTQHENYIQPKAPSSLSQVPQGALNAVKNFIPDIPRSAYELGKGLIYDPITKTYKNVKEQGVVKGAEIAGKSLLGAGGDILSYPAKKAVDIAVDPMGELQRQGEFIQERPAMAVFNVGAALEGGGALTGVKGLSTVGKYLNPVNVAGKAISKTAGALSPGLARRGFGYMAKDLTHPGELETANATAKAGMENGVMPITGNVNKAKSNAIQLLEKTGKQLDTIRKDVSASGTVRYDPIELIRKVSAQIEPKLAHTDKSVLNEIVDNIYNEVPNFTEKGITIDQATALLKKLKDKSKFDTNTKATVTNAYKQAYGIARTMLDEKIEQAGIAMGKTDLINQYKSLKTQYGQADDLVDVLTYKAGSVAGNHPFGLIGAGAGGLAAVGLWGHNPALAIPLALEELYRYRPGVYAHGAKLAEGAGKGISKGSKFVTLPSAVLNTINNKVNEKRTR